MQNFFTSADNGRRANPAQVSGKTLEGQVRMKVKGESKQVMSYIGCPNGDDTITLKIVVNHPETGETLFNESLTCKKK